VGEHQHPNAVTLAVIGKVLATTRRTHPYIFNALRRVVSGGDPETVYSDYGIEFRPRLPDAEDLRWFCANVVGDMGELRERTRSARLWSGVQLDGLGLAAVISFWAREASVQDDDIALIVQQLTLRSPVWVECIDSTKPRLVEGA